MEGVFKQAKKDYDNFIQNIMTILLYYKYSASIFLNRSGLKFFHKFR